MNRHGVVLTGILNGDATATNVTTGTTETLNLQDPDSMTLNPLGELVMTSQGDGELIIVQHPGLSCQNALVVPLTSAAGGSTIGNTQLYDTVFANQSAGELLVADKQLNTASRSLRLILGRARTRQQACSLRRAPRIRPSHSSGRPTCLPDS